jgi:predicted DNA-binding transcriptional regulator AlpA
LYAVVKVGFSEYCGFELGLDRESLAEPRIDRAGGELMPRIHEQGRRRVLELLDDDVEIVMSVRQWAQVANLGYSTAKRLMASGDGPKKTRLTMHRIGITASSHAAWLAERTED